MSYDTQYFSSLAPAIFGLGKRFSYTTDDSIASVLTEGYFSVNDDEDDLVNTISVGDIIFVTTTSVNATKSGSYICSAVSVSPVVCQLQTYGKLTGSDVETLGVGNTAASIALYNTIRTDGGATGNTTIVLDQAINITDVVVRARAAGTTDDTIQVKNGSNNITDAINIASATAGSLVRASSINITYGILQAGDSLVVTETSGSGSDSPAVDVFIYGIKLS